jgi:hypothetical protein
LYGLHNTFKTLGLGVWLAGRTLAFHVGDPEFDPQHKKKSELGPSCIYLVISPRFTDVLKKQKIWQHGVFHPA